VPTVMRSWFLLLGLVAPLVAAVPAHAVAPPPALKAASAVLMDAGSGRVLFAANADEERGMASMTKIMTLYLALKALKAGRVHADDPVAVSEEAYRTPGSQIWLEPGEQLPFHQLLRAIAVGSANDAAVAVAEHVAGTVPAFVEEMNREAKRLGMTHTHFANPHGLDEPGHYSTARDLARLARAAVQMPELLALTSLREDRTIRDGKGGQLWLVNHNRLLGQYIGLDGLKTGYTSRAGYCLTATARRDGMRLIAVVMGAPTSKDRFEGAAALLSYGFREWQSVPVVAADAVVARLPVEKGGVATVPIRVEAPVSLTIPRQAKPSLRVEKRLPMRLTAPVRRGARVGTLVVYEGGSEAARVPLVAARSVDRMTPVRLFLALLRGVLRL
jgi:D-alanyl-D-alanine carboxypeptidase (penicillin-binding protein 5/6)